MFWQSYEVTPVGEFANAGLVRSDPFWENPPIVFRSKLVPTAEVRNVICRWVEREDRLYTRGLYIPIRMNVIERLLVFFCRGEPDSDQEGKSADAKREKQKRGYH